MELLKSKKAFEFWKKEHIFAGDIAEDPVEFPCFVTTRVENWNYQEERAVYFYRSNLEEMLNAGENAFSSGRTGTLVSTPGRVWSAVIKSLYKL